MVKYIPKTKKKKGFFKQTYKQKKAAKVNTDFPIATIQGSREQYNISHVLSENKYQPRIIYAAKMLSRKRQN